MSPNAPLGLLLHSFFADHLITVKGRARRRCVATATRSGC